MPNPSTDRDVNEAGTFETETETATLETETKTKILETGLDQSRDHYDPPSSYDLKDT